MKTNYYKILMYTCFIYFGISFEFLYIQILPIITNPQNFALPPAPFTYNEIYQTSPTYIYYILIITLLGCILSLLTGIALYNITKNKEKTQLKNNWINDITNENDKKIIQLLKENNNQLTQAQLTKKSGLTKVKIHRITEKLKTNKIIIKEEHGKTNKIKLIS